MMLDCVMCLWFAAVTVGVVASLFIYDWLVRKRK